MTVDDSGASGVDVERLIRWTAAGGEWRVVARDPASVTVSLLTCGADQEMERIVSSDACFIAYVEACSSGQSQGREASSSEPGPQT